MKTFLDQLLHKRHIVLWLLSCCAFQGQGQGENSMAFHFGTNVQEGMVVNGSTVWPYEEYGIAFGLSGEFQEKKTYLTSNESFAFWVKVPEGNYAVTLVVGDTDGISKTTVKAESRRLMVYNYETTQGEVDTLSFMVNIRSARIADDDSIRLKSRELDYLNWDSNLTLEFGGQRPCIREVIIERKAAPTIFLAGNSTVVDQEREPWASWGQMFPLFLKPGVAVANFAESGEALKSFIGAGRLRKIASLIQPGDYLFMEFAHNDQKPGGSHVEPYGSYEEYLMKLVNVAREHGATPVLVTSTNRRKFDDAGLLINTLEAYPEAMRQLAKSEGLLLIDLNAMSKELYEALGPEGSKKAFVHYAAGTFPWQKDALADNTHFSTYGAWQLAKCVVQGIQDTDSALKDLLKEDCVAFDPKNPDANADWQWPVTKNGSVMKPDGN